MNITCCIGARGGSKGVPGKNSRALLGKPLIAWTIEQAKMCPEISRVVVSTDSEQIAAIGREYGAEVPFMRPSRLADDNAGKWEVWQHALAETERFFDEKTDVFVDLDCTSPLRDVSDISNAIALFLNSDVDGVFSVCEARKNPYFNMVEQKEGRIQICKELPGKIVRRQDAPKVFEHVASIYVLSPDYVRSGTGLLSGRAIGYDIGVEKSLDVDSEFDFKLIEFLMQDKMRLSVRKSGN